nr:hypothetical protein [Odonatan tombus-related virus]
MVNVEGPFDYNEVMGPYVRTIQTEGNVAVNEFTSAKNAVVIRSYGHGAYLTTLEFHIRGVDHRVFAKGTRIMGTMTMSLGLEGTTSDLIWEDQDPLQPGLFFIQTPYLKWVTRETYYDHHESGGEHFYSRAKIIGWFDTVLAKNRNLQLELKLITSKQIPTNYFVFTLSVIASRPLIVPKDSDLELPDWIFLDPDEDAP